MFLCANSNVSHWLNPLLARIERQSLQLSALSPQHANAAILAEIESDEDDRVVVQTHRNRVKRRWWNVPTCGRLDVRPASAHEWQKSLDALAHAWSRLLLLVGWRRR
jgi:hypothetical protein